MARGSKRSILGNRLRFPCSRSPLGPGRKGQTPSIWGNSRHSPSPALDKGQTASAFDSSHHSSNDPPNRDPAAVAWGNSHPDKHTRILGSVDTARRRRSFGRLVRVSRWIDSPPAWRHSSTATNASVGFEATSRCSWHHSSTGSGPGGSDCGVGVSYAGDGITKDALPDAFVV